MVNLIPTPGPGTTLREKRKERHGEREMQLAEWMTLRSAYFFKDFIYLFLEQGEQREIEKETSVCGCL